MASSSDVARLAGVSRSTVSAVLNGKAEERRIAPETVAKVMAAAEELGYGTSYHAESLRTGTARALAMVSLRESPAAQLLQDAICDAALERGLLLSLPPVQEQRDERTPYDDLLDAVDALRTGCVDAVVVDCDYDADFSGACEHIGISVSDKLLRLNAVGADAPHQVSSDCSQAVLDACLQLATAGGRVLCACSAATIQRLAGGREARHLLGLGKRAGIDLVLHQLTEDDDLPALVREHEAAGVIVEDSAHALSLRDAGLSVALVLAGDDGLADLLEPAVAWIDEKPAALAKQIMRLLDGEAPRRVHARLQRGAGR